MEKYFEKELDGEYLPPLELERPVRSGGALFLRYGVRSCTAGSAVYAEISAPDECSAEKAFALWIRTVVICRMLESGPVRLNRAAAELQARLDNELRDLVLLENFFAPSR